jgi:hypothetical protein
MNSREYDVAQLDELVGVDGREVLTRRLRWRHEERDARPASAGSTKGNLIPATPPSSPPPPLPGPFVDANTIISFLNRPAAPTKRTTTTTPFLFNPHPFSPLRPFNSHSSPRDAHTLFPVPTIPYTRDTPAFGRVFFEAVVLGFGGDANIA